MRERRKRRRHAHLGRRVVEQFEAEHGQVSHRAPRGLGVVEVMFVSRDDTGVLVDDLEREDKDLDLVAEHLLHDMSAVLARPEMLGFEHLLHVIHAQIRANDDEHKNQDCDTENEQPIGAERVLALLAHLRRVIPAPETTRARDCLLCHTNRGDGLT